MSNLPVVSLLKDGLQAEPSGKSLRVGIVTFHFVPNYGAVWQAWALQEAISKLGHDAQIVNYHPSHVFEGGWFKWPISRRNLKANLVIAYQHYLRIRSLFGYRKVINKHFKQFEDHHFRLTMSSYSNFKELQDNPPDVDVLVCGSDQIWNPSVQAGLDPAYFLDFGGREIRRFSYAASFGRSIIDSDFFRQIGTYTRKLDAISVRELSGVQIIHSTGTKTPVIHLPDPTLLVDEFPIESPPPESPSKFIFSYVLRSGEGIDKLQRRIAQEIAAPIVSPLNPHATSSLADHHFTLTPTQWLGCIRDAEAVVTNSFHGTLFSVIFQKPFITVGIGSGKAAMNERVRSLFEQLGLEDRFVDISDAAKASDRLNEPIDWTRTRGRILDWRNSALDYLRSNLTTI